MTAFYSLWDIEVGTSLGTYESEAEALSIVAALVEANGPAYARLLDLGRHEPDGAGTSVATGDALLTRLQEWRGERLAGVGVDD